MTNHYTCGGCTNAWTGLSQAHCPSCHETFGGITNFDRHRLDGACRHPSEIGLSIGARGVWSEPFSWQRAETDEPIEKVMEAFRNAPAWARGVTKRPDTDHTHIHIDTTPRSSIGPDTNYLNIVYHDTQDDGWTGNH